MDPKEIMEVIRGYILENILKLDPEPRNFGREKLLRMVSLIQNQDVASLESLSDEVLAETVNQFEAGQKQIEILRLGPPPAANVNALIQALVAGNVADRKPEPECLSRVQVIFVVCFATRKDKADVAKWTDDELLDVMDQFEPGKVPDASSNQFFVTRIPDDYERQSYFSARPKRRQ